MTIPAQLIYNFTVLIPAGTDISAPITEDTSFPQGSVVAVRWRVPPGPSGYMGFQVTSDGAPVIPQQQATYIVSDNEYDTWPIAGYQDSGSWQVTGYNLDGYDHSVYLTFFVVQPGGDQPGAGAQAPAPVTTSNTQLSSPGPDTSEFVAGLQVQT